MPLDLSKPRRIELILRQIDALPTLPAIAARLLQLTSSDEAEARQIIELVSADPALTAKILSMVRAADKGVAATREVISLDRAVVLLGFSAVRNAVLSLKVLETFGDQPDAQTPDAGSDETTRRFDRRGHWLHSLGVAIAAERIAAAHKRPDLPAGEAFVCGLLHGIGKLALDHVLPRSFAKVIELTEARHGDIAEFERQVIGIDHHTAGKRLAEQWGLPHAVQDCIWLHGSAYDTLPPLEHRRMVGLIGLADLLVRQRHVGYAGNHHLHHDADEIATKLGLDPPRVQEAVADLHEQLETRGKALGIHDEPAQALVVESIARANAALGRLNATLDRRSRATAAQSQVLDAIAAFHQHAEPGRSTQDVLDQVVASARGVFGPGFYALLFPTAAAAEELADQQSRQESGEDRHTAWLVAQYSSEGAPTQARYVAAPRHIRDLSVLGASFEAAGGPGVDLMGVLPWIADYLVNADDLRQVRLLPLPCAWGTAAVLLHDRPSLPAWPLLAPLARTWGAAVAAAAEHDGARRLSEQIAESNAALAAAQDRLLRTESMARLGEMASGAAHEMNNPLAVISGRSQLLSLALEAGTKEQKAAQTIYREAHRLSDLITNLHMFADPPKPDRKPTDLRALISTMVQKLDRAHRRRAAGVEIDLMTHAQTPPVWVDSGMIERALTELLLNALQAEPKTAIRLSLDAEGEDTVRIEVHDDGQGMDAHTLEHALDPFFSSKPAGRRVGMGLPKAQQLITAHGGELTLRSEPGKGTKVTIYLPLHAEANTAQERKIERTEEPVTRPLV